MPRRLWFGKQHCDHIRVNFAFHLAGVRRYTVSDSATQVMQVLSIDAESPPSPASGSLNKLAIFNRAPVLFRNALPGC